MRFFIDRWRRIGTRLYLALGFAVALTLISGGVAVYYFEQSGDHNYRVQSESVPALESSWIGAREAERLRILGLEVVEAQRDRHQRGHTKTWGRNHRRIDIHFHRGLRRNAG